jgi:hypothetical protein
MGMGGGKKLPERIRTTDHSCTFGRRLFLQFGPFG